MKHFSVKRIETTQQRCKVQFEKKHKFWTFVLNMLVMLQDIKKLKFLNKFDALWLEPFIIK
jgi:hypothetical protein